MLFFLATTSYVLLDAQKYFLLEFFPEVSSLVKKVIENTDELKKYKKNETLKEKKARKITKVFFLAFCSKIWKDKELKWWPSKKSYFLSDIISSSAQPSRLWKLSEKMSKKYSDNSFFGVSFSLKENPSENLSAGDSVSAGIIAVGINAKPEEKDGKFVAKESAFCLWLFANNDEEEKDKTLEVVPFEKFFPELKKNSFFMGKFFVIVTVGTLVLVGTVSWFLFKPYKSR